MSGRRGLDCDTGHYVWDNAIPARLEIDSGDTVVFRTRDALDGFYTAGQLASGGGADPARPAGDHGGAARGHQRRGVSASVSWA
ncbi:MAG TPA: hypothetical protein DCK98_07560 [Chloroflexi bacterium]|jgi:acetamidase/formamidase|nr:hypothetical protein [Chloroflexota bacterium]HAL26852.1 hypothetical protein [Chloroflexota bacterium]